MDIKETVKPLVLKHKLTGEKYTLDFSRETVLFAEARDFCIDDVSRFPATKFPELFFYAFRKNHKGVSRAETDEMLNGSDGLHPELVIQLVQLYKQAQYAGCIQEKEEFEKNGVLAVVTD